MSSRRTIYLTDKSEFIIGRTESLSGRINSIISRYARITEADAPAMTVAEWSLLCDMLNSTAIEENTGDYLWADIAEAGGLDGLADKWEVDTKEFSSRVRDMSSAARYHILDIVSKFWQHPKLNDLSTAALLEGVGAKITE